VIYCRSQWPCGLRRRSAAARLLRSWVWIPPGAWMFVCECRVLSGRGLCDELITRPEESYRLRCVVVCDLETSRMRRPWPALDCYQMCCLLTIFVGPATLVVHAVVVGTFYVMPSTVETYRELRLQVLCTLDLFSVFDIWLRARGCYCCLWVEWLIMNWL
jgi:hypothetical protein